MKKTAPIIFGIIIVIIVIVLAISSKKDTAEDTLGTDTNVEVTDSTNTDGEIGGPLTGFTAKLQGQWILEGTTQNFIHIRDSEIAYAMTGIDTYFPMRIEAPYIYVTTPEKEIKYTFDFGDADDISDTTLMLMGEGEDEILKLVRPQF